jgi:hypothetical protein
MHTLGPPLPTATAEGIPEPSLVFCRSVTLVTNQMPVRLTAGKLKWTLVLKSGGVAVMFETALRNEFRLQSVSLSCGRSRLLTRCSLTTNRTVSNEN